MNRILSFLFLIFSGSLLSFAQKVEILPVDPRVTSGKLANGLSYYIVKNSAVKGYADFYLVQKVGSSLENENEKGMTDLIGEMAMRGTRNFPGNTILEYFDDLGMSLRTDFERKVGLDDSYFRISNVPVGRRSAIIDSTLLILFNWSCCINFDEEDLAQERDFLCNFFVEEMDLSRRIKMDNINQLLSGTDYALLPSAVFKGVREHSSKNLRSYYYKWFRPDLQAVIVVGDVDVASMEKQIKTLFQATPKEINPPRREYASIDGNKDLELSVCVDREATSSIVSLVYKSNVLEPSLRGSAVPYVIDYMDFVMKYLLEERFAVAADTTSIPIFSYSVDFDKYLGVKEMDALTLKIETSPEYVLQALAFLTTQAESVRRYGFSRSEFSRAKGVFYRNLDYIYAWRGSMDNSVYAQRCTSHFLDGYSLASIEMQKEYMDKVRPEIRLDQLNTYARSFIRHQGNSVITCSSPVDGSSTMIDPEQMKSTYIALSERDIAQYEETPELSNIVHPELVPGKIVTDSKEPITDSYLWKLSNGATVVFKHTDSSPEKFCFDAMSKGGLSSFDGNALSLARYINDIAATQTIGGESAMEIGRLMKENDIVLEKNISLSVNHLQGSAFSRSIKRFMELVYLHFTASGTDSVAYDKLRNVIIERDAYLNNSPKYLLDKTKYSRMCGYDFFCSIDGIDYRKVSDFIINSFSNPADFVFTIVGDYDVTLLKELVCKYIGSIPEGSNKKNVWKAGTFAFSKYDQELMIKADMEIERSIYSYTLMAPSAINLNETSLVGLASLVIERRLASVMAEKGISLDYSDYQAKYPQEYVFFDISFVTKDFSGDYLRLIKEALSDLAAKGASQSEIDVAKTFAREQFLYRKNHDNMFWMEILENRFIYGKDFYTKFLSHLDSLTTEAVNDSIRKLLAESNSIKIIVKP